MYIILTYDVGVKRNSKVLKMCRKYLTHVQKSVFEGNVNDKQLKTLKNALAGMIDCNIDQVAIYKYEGHNEIQKEIIGYHLMNNNII